MKTEKREGEWRVVLEATCPNCGHKVEALKPKNRPFYGARSCRHCGHRVDRAYFN